MSSSDPQAPAENGGAPSSTQEIPVVQPAAATPAQQPLPPHPGATPPAPVQPVEAPVATGPVDFVPAPPGAANPPPPRPAPAADPEPAPATAPGPVWPQTLESEQAAGAGPSTARARAPRDRAALIGVGLTVLSLALLELGLSMRGGDAESYWERIPLWSGFATLCGVLALAAFAAFFATGNRLRTGPAWRIAAAGLVGLAVFWLLVVLPVVDTDRGFVLTAALGALGGALWIGPRRGT
ncbi:UNVERIFIED_ORG: hypothetical protein E4P37_14595 [Bacillus sp. AZ43]